MPQPLVSTSKNVKTTKETREKPVKNEWPSSTDKVVNALLTKNFQKISPKCSTCAMTFTTDIGIKMHQPYHRFGSFMRKLKKVHRKSVNLKNNLLEKLICFAYILDERYTNHGRIEGYSGNEPPTTQFRNPFTRT